jgi:two-component sensor histidine kinase
MERSCVLLFREADRFFPALRDVEPRIYENLLAPWHVKGEAVGTLWAIQHTPEKRFDAEDARVLQSLARVAAAAFQMTLALDEVTAERAELQQRTDALRESEERQAFFLKLSDAIRPLAHPTDIQGETTRLLREQLNAAWCYYVDWDLERKVGLVLRDSSREGLPSLVGAHDVSDAPEFLHLLEGGAVLAVRDYASYKQLPTRTRQQFTTLGFRSMMAAPLVKEGRLLATLLVGETQTRDWSGSEASLLLEAAERTWAAVERARTEEALRASERHAQTLLAELQHRVRNILAMMRSVIRRASRSKTDVKDFVQHLEGRINAMARTQALLTRAPGQNVDLEDMIRDELLAQAADDRKAVVHGPEIRLSPHAVELVTLAIHELATNSVKYGALGRGDGRLDVSWKSLGDDEQQRLELTWQETGLKNSASGSPGFGTELITQRVPYELNGRGEIKIAEGKLTATIEFPLEHGSSMLETQPSR